MTRPNAINAQISALSHGSDVPVMIGQRSTTGSVVRETRGLSFTLARAGSRLLREILTLLRGFCSGARTRGSPAATLRRLRVLRGADFFSTLRRSAITRLLAARARPPG